MQNLTVYTAGSTFLALVLGVSVALALRKPFFGRGFVRAAMLIPYVAPVVAVTFVWKVLLNPELGIVVVRAGHPGADRAADRS